MASCSRGTTAQHGKSPGNPPDASGLQSGPHQASSQLHVLRHTWASLTVMNGAPLLVVAKNLGHSSTRMVEKHYGHLAPSFIAEAIRDAAPRFGLPSERTVTALRVRHPSRAGRR
jgi:hypothetical protein